MPQTQFERDSLAERGRVLTGRFAHYCNDWDGLTVDETCIEAQSCHDVDYDEAAIATIEKTVIKFEAAAAGVLITKG